MSPLERETKLLLAPEDVSKIRDGGRLVSCTDQLNVYLHDPARLAEHLGYFRIRYETGREPTATLKIPAGWRGEMREMVEVERPLAELGPGFYPRPHRWATVSDRVPEGFMEHFRSLGITRLRRLGWTRNRRWTVALGGAGTVELDRLILPGGAIHHEVEIEHPSEARHRDLVERVRDLAPSAEFTRVGKFSRFLEAMGLL